MVITLVLFCPSLTAFWTQTILPSSKVTKDFTWAFYRWDWLIWKDSWTSPQEREGGFFKSKFSGFTCRPSGVDSSNSSLSCKLDNWRKSNEACERIFQFKSTIVLFVRGIKSNSTSLCVFWLKLYLCGAMFWLCILLIDQTLIWQEAHWESKQSQFFHKSYIPWLKLL